MPAKWECKVIDAKRAGGGGLFSRAPGNDEVGTCLNRLRVEGREIITLDFQDVHASAGRFLGVAKRPRT